MGEQSQLQVARQCGSSATWERALSLEQAVLGLLQVEGVGGSVSWGSATFCIWLVVGSMPGVCKWGSVPSVSLGNGTGGAQVSGGELR